MEAFLKVDVEAQVFYDCEPLEDERRQPVRFTSLCAMPPFLASLTCTTCMHACRM